MNKFISLLFLGFLLFSNNFYSQNGTTPPVIVPPAPEATSLFKFLETPVNLNNGMANINIPIYTIQTKGVDIPIALSYHGRGIQVAELASRVGMGWTLQTGGMVSRQTRGKSDDGQAGGYLKTSFYSDFFTNVNTRNSTYQAYANDMVDFDPDKFMFSFPGHSGSFIFDQATKKPWQQKHSDIKIKPIWNHPTDIIKGFRIVDDKGNTYYFGALDNSVSVFQVKGDKEIAPGKWVKNNGEAGLMPVSAPSEGFTGWHLIKIVTYFNEEITFSYDPEIPQYIRKSYDENLSDSGSATAITYYSEVNSTQYQISQITFPGGKVVFNKNSIPRLDLAGAHSLNNIEVLDHNDAQVKKFVFEYDVVTSDTNTNYSSFLATPESFKRIFLKSLTETAGSTSQPSYKFLYSSVKLPNRLSSSQDNWGYFNGANNGPFMPFFNYGNYTMDRRVDPTKNGAGLLQKIIYPTGGSVSYEYEQNVAVKPAFLDQTVSPGNNPQVLKNAFLGNLHLSNWDANQGIFRKPVVIGENKSSTVTSNVHFTYYDYMDGPCQIWEPTAECRFSMLLVGQSNSYQLHFGNNISMAGVPPGNYELHVYPPMQDSTVYFTAELRWYEEEALQDNLGNPLMLASGKRIKKVIYSDGLSDIKVKEYEYINPAGGNSGKVFGYPNFYAIKETVGGYNILNRYGSTPGSPLTSFQGNDLSYSYVTEYEGTKTANIGKTEYEFTNPSDGGTYYHFPHHLPIDNQWLRGNLLNTKIFKTAGTGYSLIKKIENQYIYGGDELLINITAKLGTDLAAIAEKVKDSMYYQIPLAIFTPDDNQQNGHSYKVYYQKGGTADLYSSITTDYLTNESGNQQVLTSTNFTYNYPKHYQRSKEITVIDGKTITAHTTYSSEVAGVTTLGYTPLTTLELSRYTELKAANRIIPVQTEVTTKVGTTVLSGSVQRTIFNTFGSSLRLPAKSQSATLGSSLKDDLIFHRYDVNGNLLQVYRPNGPSTSYIWGYSGQNPVAKVENATYQSIENLPQHFGSGFNLGSGGLNLNQDNALRTLPGALVTTYQYKPLVGVSNIKDANGNTMTYTYDPFERLEEIYNQDNHLLKRYNYKFKSN